MSPRVHEGVGVGNLPEVDGGTVQEAGVVLGVIVPVAEHLPVETGAAV